MNAFRFCIFVCLLCQLVGRAQTNQQDLKLEKAKELVRDKKTSDAEKYMLELLKDDPSYGDGWDFLAQIRYLQYTDAEKLPGLGNLSFTVKSKDGKETDGGNDTLIAQLKSMLSKYDPSKLAYSKYIYSLRKATLMSNEAWQSSAYLRRLFVDVNIDSNVSRDALKYFNEAETLFGEKNYVKAATLYKRATEEQPDFYKARMYMGDCFYASHYYSDALAVFKEAAQRYPYLLEPAKYLTDAYARLELYDKSLDEAIRSMTIYPDVSMMFKLRDAAYINEQKFDILWTRRGVLPNKPMVNEKSDMNTYHEPDSIAPGSPWVEYKKEGDRVLQYCDGKGLIKPNSVTKTKYLELYSWEQMLENSSDSTLAEAKRMQKLHFLDCYVMVTCFHYDFYDQYLDFVTNNKDKVFQYYRTFLKKR
jgi:tetratricopeptide (TPR) repeat protein